MTSVPVIPAKAGIQGYDLAGFWIPAFAGMTASQASRSTGIER